MTNDSILIQAGDLRIGDRILGKRNMRVEKITIQRHRMLVNGKAFLPYDHITIEAREEEETK